MEPRPAPPAVIEEAKAFRCTGRTGGHRCRELGRSSSNEEGEPLFSRPVAERSLQPLAEDSLDRRSSPGREVLHEQNCVRVAEYGRAVSEQERFLLAEPGQSPEDSVFRRVVPLASWAASVWPEPPLGSLDPSACLG